MQNRARRDSRLLHTWEENAMRIGPTAHYQSQMNQTQAASAPKKAAAATASAAGPVADTKAPAAAAVAAPAEPTTPPGRIDIRV